MEHNYIWIDGKREEMVCALPDEQAGELYRDLVHYAATGNKPDSFSNSAVKQAFETMVKDDAEIIRRLNNGQAQDV